jgi:tetratricopeptide (TPR) repeat protein
MKFPKYTAYLLVAVVAFSWAGMALAGWEYDIAVADKLMDSGYYDAAVSEYQKIATTYSGQSPAEDKAWFGLSRAYHLSGNIPAAKLSAEKCLEIGNDQESDAGARELYKTLQSEAHAKKLEVEKAYQYYETEYKRTSWLNIITKVLNYFDLRKVRKELNEAEEYDSTFEPKYLIDPIVIEKPAEEVIDVAADKPAEDITIDDQSGNETLDSDMAVIDDEPVVQETEVVITEAAPSSDPAVVLQQTRETYLAAYRKLQEALQGQNQQEVQAANEAFQAASKAYKEAQAVVAAQ